MSTDKGPKIVTNPFKRDPHRERFVRNFRRFLLKAGFGKEEVAIQGATEEGPDIILTHTAVGDVKVKVIIQCKSTEEEGKQYSALNDLIRKYGSYVNQYAADVALLALKGYSIPDKFKDPDVMEKIKHREKVVYWDDEIIRYYQDTIKTLESPYSKYVLLRDLRDLRLKLQDEPYVVDALQIRQHPRGKTIWIFPMEPRKLLNIIYVFRRASMNPRAYQRMLREKRLRRIGKFVSDEGTLLVNNLVVAFEEKVKFENGKLHIPARTCSVWIIDGQHRLYGFLKLSKKLSRKKRNKILKDYKLIVSGIKSEPLLQAKLFQEINTYQTKINRNLLLDLYDYLEVNDENNILQRVRVAKKLRKTPTFKSKIKILRTEKGRITLAGIVDYFRFTDLVMEYRKKSYTILSEFFRAVAETFPDEWKKPKKFVFATNKGVRMLLSLLTRILWYCKRKNVKPNYATMKSIIEALRESCQAEKEYFLMRAYTGKALGAGRADIVARDLWTTRIDEKLGDFLSENEKSKIVGHASSYLEKLELRLRECIQTKLAKTSKKWWKERIPPDVRSNAQERKKKNENPWPWFKAQKLPIAYYLDFSDYIKIIQRKDNWPIFKPIFKDETILVAKLKELKPIRDNIAHYRKLTPDMLERLKMYSTDLITCIDKALKK